MTRCLPKLMISLGLLLLAMTAYGAVALFQFHHDTVIAITLAQCMVYAIVACLIWRGKNELTPQQDRRLFWFVLGFAILMRALLVGAPPHSTDIYRYVWDGRVQADGINPYRYIPAAPELSHLRDDNGIYVNINRKEYAPTIYPPFAQAVYFLASRVGETVTMMKLSMLLFEALGVWALVRMLQLRGLPLMLSALYLWHPLPLWEVAGSGHVDIIAAAFIWLSYLAAEKGARLASGAALAAGVLTKYFPLTLTPALYRRWDWKMPLAFGMTALVLYAPYVSAGKKIFGFLGGYADEELKAGEGIYIASLLKQMGLGQAALPVFVLLVAATLFALAWRTGFRAKPEKPDIEGGFRIAIAFAVFFSPHYAWYFLWLVPFLCFKLRLSALWLTLTAPTLYKLGWPPDLLGASLQYVPFAAFLLFENLNVTLLFRKEISHGRTLA